MECGYLQWRASPQPKSSGFVKAVQSYVHVKIALLFFLSIYSWCGALASWAARHTTMCLDTWHCYIVLNTMFDLMLNGLILLYRGGFCCVRCLKDDVKMVFWAAHTKIAWNPRLLSYCWYYQYITNQYENDSN